MTDNALTKTAPTSGGLDRPDHHAAPDNRGMEHVTREDVKLPQLRMAQSLSKPLEEGHELYIPGLKLGQLYNDLTGEIYGVGPLEFVVIRGDKPKYMQFDPVTRAVIDYSVPENDPRTKFTVGADGKSVKPVAQKIYDFVIVLLPSLEMMTLSLSSSGIKAATLLNGLMLMRKAPIYSGKYTMATAKKTGVKGTYFVHVMKNSGLVNEFCAMKGDKPLTGWLSQEWEARMAAQFEAIRNKTLDIAREPGDDEFDGAAMDGAAEGHTSDM